MSRKEMTEQEVSHYLATQFGAGWAEGAATTLSLLLGIPTAGAKVFEGTVPPDIEAWARDALAVMAADGVPTAIKALR